MSRCISGNLKLCLAVSACLTKKQNPAFSGVSALHSCTVVESKCISFTAVQAGGCAGWCTCSPMHSFSCNGCGLDRPTAAKVAADRANCAALMHQQRSCPWKGQPRGSHHTQDFSSHLSRVGPNRLRHPLYNVYNLQVYI